MNDICHKSNENTDKYKNQRAAAVVLTKIYFYDYITWFSEPCAVLLVLCSVAHNTHIHTSTLIFKVYLEYFYAYCVTVSISM